MSYTVLHEAEAPHICDLPATHEYYPGTVIECNDCGVSYILGEGQPGRAPSWTRRPKPPAPRPPEER